MFLKILHLLLLNYRKYALQQPYPDLRRKKQEGRRKKEEKREREREKERR
ncbi:MAG: hypothetical protein HC786_33160, partial [Richelia sp. CSU_2_1]|nr:hypothetical protein [Richelia sp. CSU_2_1]